MSVNSAGQQANDASYAPVTSGTGRYVAFESGATNLVDGARDGGQIFLRDRRTGRTELVSVAKNGGPHHGHGDMGEVAISDDGSLLAFSSTAPDIVDGDRNARSDVFVRHVRAGTTEPVSLAADGGEANGASYLEGMSADDRSVMMLSNASDMVAGDTNGRNDMFVRDRSAGVNSRVNVRSSGAQAKGGRFLFRGDISADGRVTTFATDAFNLVPGDTNGRADTFVHITPATTP